MKNSVLKNVYSVLLVSILAFTSTLFFYPSLLDTISFGEDDTLSKGFAYAIPVLILVFGLILALLPLTEPKREYDARSARNYRNGNTIVLSVLTLVQVFYLIRWSGVSLFDTMDFAIIALGFIAMVVGNYIPTLTRESFFAFYNPWTIADPAVWRKTHRFGGYVWIMGGCGIIACTLLDSQYNLWFVISCLFFMLMIPTIFSLAYSLRLKRKN